MEKVADIVKLYLINEHLGIFADVTNSFKV